MANLRGVGDPLKTDPHKRMLKRSKRLGKKMSLKGGKKKLTNPNKEFDYGGRMFSPEAWKAD